MTEEQRNIEKFMKQYLDEKWVDEFCRWTTCLWRSKGKKIIIR